MRARETGAIENTRMMNLQQGCIYAGMGRTTFTKWCNEIGATRRFGSLIRFDKVVIDRALDSMEQAAQAEG